MFIIPALKTRLSPYFRAPNKDEATTKEQGTSQIAQQKIPILHSTMPSDPNALTRDQLNTIAAYTDQLTTTVKEIVTKRVSELEANERANIVQQMNSLIPITRLGERYRLFLHLLEVSAGERESLVQQMIALYPTSLEPAVFKRLSIIATGERASIVKDMQFFVRHRNVSETIKAIDFLVSIPAAEREHCMQLAKPLFPKTVDDEGDRFNIFEHIVGTPTGKRECSLQNAKDFFTSSMNVQEKMRIFRFLRLIPANEQAGIIQLAKPLLELSMDESHIGNILHRLYKIPGNERESMVQQVKSLSTVGMMHTDILSLIETLQRIPVTKRANVLEHAKALEIDSCSLNDTEEILKKLSYLSVEEGGELVRDIKGLIPNTINAATRAHLINIYTSIPRQQGIAFIKAYLLANVDENYLRAIVKNQEAQVPEPTVKEATLDEILATDLSTSLPADLDPKHQEMLLKALKIKRHYNNLGYICFLHGQEPSRLILQLLLKEIAKIRNPEQHFKNPFVYLRSAQFYEQTKGHTDQIAEELKKMIKHDTVQRDPVMSVDAYFLSMAPHESANYFCGETRSVAPLAERGASDLDPLLGELHEGAISVIKREIDALMTIVSHKMPCGNLCVVCIPKDKVMNYSYPARPGGKFCPCRSDAETLQQLIDANKDIEPKCKRGKTTQWRLATAALRPENGVRSFALSPLGDMTFLLEEYIKPLAAKIVYLQAKIPKSRL